MCGDVGGLYMCEYDYKKRGAEEKTKKKGKKSVGRQRPCISVMA